MISLSTHGMEHYMRLVIKWMIVMVTLAVKKYLYGILRVLVFLE
jgi:hypothetical protein